MATIEERLAALEALLGMSEGETPYVSQYSGPDIDEGIELARSGTVRKTGDTMTGDLNIAKPTNNNRLTLASDTGYSALRHLETLTSGTDYRQLMLYGNAATLKDCLRLYSVVGGKNDATHYIYHTGNKPTPADIGAVSKSGDTMKGSLNFKQAENGYSSIFKNNTTDADYGSGFYDYSASGALAGLNLNGQAQIASLSFSSSGLHEILHTGNMNSLISSLRIATGTYTGTGNYGGVVTLTCGFKPAFAIVYQADANDLEVAEESGGWSSTFAVLVPTATGRKINIGQTSVSVESGDTYLKITSTAHELNQNIAYNYIIVGS